MPIHWLQASVDALREQDPKKVPALCEKARRAINDRLLQRDGQPPNEREKERLEETLRHLTQHDWYTRQKPN